MERDVVDQVNTLMRIPRRRRHTIARELRSHIEEAQQELQLSGLPSDEAVREGLARFGNPVEIASAFGEVYRPTRRRRVGLAFALAGALLTGAYGFSGTLASATPTHHRPVLHVKVSNVASHSKPHR